VSAEVWITGVGVVTPLGVGARDTLDAVRRGRRAPAPLTTFDAGGFAQPNGSETLGLDARPYFSMAKALKLTDRAARFAVVAAQLALADRTTSHRLDLERLGVAIGSSGSDLQAPALGAALAGLDETQVANIPQFADRILRGVSPLWLLVNLPNMISAHVSIQVGAQGPNTTVMSDWIAGLQAIGEAADWIRAGEADLVLAGGSDSAIRPFAYASFEQAGLFCGEDRFVPGEGAAIVCVESADSALKWGARCRAVVRGYATAAATSTAPSAVTGALAAVSCKAINEACWDRDRVSFMASFVPSLGHALAAAAPIDLALTLASESIVDSRALLCTAAAPSGQVAALAVERVS
jgi:3-oxoacyl-[acyl-carrier-protein] synthase II